MLQPWERQSKYRACQPFVFLLMNSASSDWKPSKDWRLLKEQSVNPECWGCFSRLFSHLESSRISLLFLLAISLAPWWVCSSLSPGPKTVKFWRSQMATWWKNREERLAQRLPRARLRRAEYNLPRRGKWVNYLEPNFSSFKYLPHAPLQLWFSSYESWLFSLEM